MDENIKCENKYCVHNKTARLGFIPNDGCTPCEMFEIDPYEPFTNPGGFRIDMCIFRLNSEKK